MAAFLRAEMTGICLDGSQLENARVIRCELASASLVGVEAKKSLWYLSSLRSAIFANANLAEADMTGADLTSADFRGAAMRMAKLDRTQQQDIRIDSGSRSSLHPPNSEIADFIIETS